MTGQVNVDLRPFLSLARDPRMQRGDITGNPPEIEWPLIKTRGNLPGCLDWGVT